MAEKDGVEIAMETDQSPDPRTPDPNAEMTDSAVTDTPSAIKDSAGNDTPGAIKDNAVTDAPGAIKDSAVKDTPGAIKDNVVSDTLGAITDSAVTAADQAVLDAVVGTSAARAEGAVIKTLEPDIDEAKIDEGVDAMALDTECPERAAGRKSGDLTQEASGGSNVSASDRKPEASMSKALKRKAKDKLVESDVDEEVYEKLREELTEKKEPDPCPLPEDLKFGFVQEEALFDNQRQMMQDVKKRFDDYKQQLTELKEKKKFETSVLLLDRDDSVSAGTTTVEEEQTALIDEYRDVLLRHLQYEPVIKYLIEKEIFTEEHDEKYLKEPDNKRRLMTMLEVLPKQDQLAVPIFFHCLRELGYKEIYNRMFAEETKPARLVVDYSAATLRFSPQPLPEVRPMDVDSSPTASTDSSMTNQRPASVSEGAPDAHDSAVGAEAKSGDKPAENMDQSGGDDPAKGIKLRPRSELRREITVTAVNIRYACLNPLGNVIFVSFWTGKDRENFQNVLIKTDRYEVFETLMLLNALRKLIYIDDNMEMFRIKSFFPICSAYALVAFFNGGKDEKPDDKDYVEHYVMFDEEGVAIFDARNHESPLHIFTMHIEYTKNSIDQIYYHGVSGHIMEIEKKKCRVFINLMTVYTYAQKESFDRIKFELRTNITPKPKDTWNFADKAALRKWAEFCEGYTKYNEEDFLYRVPTTELPRIKTPPPVNPVKPVHPRDLIPPDTDDENEDTDEDEDTGDEDAKGKDMECGGLSTSESRSGGLESEGAGHGHDEAASNQSSPPASNQSSPPASNQSSPPASNQSSPPRQEAAGADDAEKLILHLHSRDIKAADDEKRLNWTMKWSSVDQPNKGNEVPESGIGRTDLDPNDVQHFRQAIRRIKEMMEKDRMLDAVAQMRVVKEVFSRSRIVHITGWLESLDDEKRLQQVFLANNEELR